MNLLEGRKWLNNLPISLIRKTFSVSWIELLSSIPISSGCLLEKEKGLVFAR